MSCNKLGLDDEPAQGDDLEVYQRALQLACEDIKDCKRFCPRFYKMWQCSKSLCPDRQHEWTCWSEAYLKMAQRQIENDKP